MEMELQGILWAKWKYWKWSANMVDNSLVCDTDQLGSGFSPASYHLFGLGHVFRFVVLHFSQSSEINVNN